MISFLPLAILIALPMQFGGMDMAVAERWGKAKVVKYRVEGVHKGRTNVVFGDYEGKADVIDRLTVEFTWDVKKSKLIGPMTVVDGRSELSNIKSDGTNCGPPQLKGEYEHFHSVSNSAAGQQIEIRGTRTYPAASVSNYPASCSMRAIPGRKLDVAVHFVAMAPEALGMPISAGAPFSPSADRKSLTLQGAENWVWTLTPTLLQ